ncbi:MAG: flagellar basal body-associated FliL family protein [Methylobacter sp.]|jgi:flagellar FliL protein|uniref:flagellar basal body-associated FliL family protein n=1 Tax=Methylobacter sp. TaxID=2051955 RepID=UPI0025E248A8|nr:flagellar basal body-associated FliL family protein [Methylobacter sp.]MCK9619343.1 flagellar basal body-associated FliL family protein [Methylobacter sp.]
MAELEQESGSIKKSPKKLIIIIVAAIILLAAGGGATFFLMKEDSSNGKGEHADEDEAAVHAEKLYFDMSKPIVVDFPKGAAIQHGRITVSMLVEGAETIEVLKKNEPMMRNNLLMLIGAQDPASLNTREGKELLGKAMLDDVTAVLVKMAGKGKVNEIFFTSFVMQ